jgi:hypothetical protein
MGRVVNGLIVPGGQLPNAHRSVIPMLFRKESQEVEIAAHGEIVRFGRKGTA